MSASLLLIAIFTANAFSVSEAELITVTDTSFTLTWTTTQAEPGAVRFGTEPHALSAEASESAPRRFHYVTVTGLPPGRTVFYRIKSAKEFWPPVFLPPEQIRTLSPPPGRRLFTFAVMNDVHAMEDIDGLMILPLRFLPPLTPGLVWRFPVVNYWEFSLRSAVTGVNRSGAELCIVNGDLTSWFAPEEFAVVKAYLDRLRMPYYVTRGNHDRRGDYPEDYFKKTFGLESSWSSVNHRGFHFVFLDDTRPADGWCAFPEEEWAWLNQDLADHRGMPTFIFSHRPLSLGGVDIDKTIQARFLKTLSENPQVTAVFHAHTHQARAERLFGGGVLCVVVPAVKNYPSGYGLVQVSEGGLMYNFVRLDCPDCREWTRLTRGENYGLTHRKALGGVSDRNLVYPFPPAVQRLLPSE